MLNKIMQNIHNDLDNYFYENVTLKPYDKIMNFVLDIEASPTENKNEVLTYSIAIMSCDNDDYICYKYNKVSDFMDMTLSLNAEKVNFYVHNLLYDFKPFIIDLITRYNASQLFDTTYEKTMINPFNRKKEKLTLIKKEFDLEHKPFTYSVTLKKGQLYNATFYGNNVKTVTKRKYVKYKPIEINFFDTLKIAPYTLQKCCSAFLGLELPKDGLDYNKIRNIDDELTHEEKVYIYNDVFGLSEVVKKLIINGFWVNGKKVQYTKLTNSSQSLSDYKDTLLEDYRNKQNCFNDDLTFEIDNTLTLNGFFRKEEDEYQKEILFKTLFPPQNYFIDRFTRQSYYGGLSTVHFDNVEKYSKYKNSYYNTGLIACIILNFFRIDFSTCFKFWAMMWCFKWLYLKTLQSKIEGSKDENKKRYNFKEGNNQRGYIY